MEIQVNKLREALDMLKPAVPRKPTLPVIANVWLGDGKAVATDLDTAVRVNMPDIAGQAPLLLPFKDVLEFLKRAPGHRMAVITAEGKSVRLAVDGAQASFQVEDVQDYPALSPVDGDGQGVIDGDSLVRAMLAVAPYAARDDVRPALHAVCITPGDTVEIAAADGFRLAWETVPGRLAAQKQMLVKLDTVEVLAHLWRRAARPELADVSDPAGLAKAKRLMRLSWSDSRLQISFGDVAVVAQLIQGTFPNYRQLIPSGSSATITVMAEDMERALRQLARAAKDGVGVVRLTWEGEQLLVSAKSDKFETSVPLPATCTGPGKTAVSLNFLMEYCKGRTGKITLSWSTPSSPVLFSHRDHPHVVMMPMFVQWDGAKPGPEEKPAEEARSEAVQESNTAEADDSDVETGSSGGDETPAAEPEEETAPAA